MIHAQRVSRVSTIRRENTTANRVQVEPLRVDFLNKI
jgi:hypothetical protein